MKKRICVVTASRADYGLLCWLMKAIKESPDLELLTVVTGAHLSRKFGYTINEIIRDGFEDLVKIKVSDDTSSWGIAASGSQILAKFADFFDRKKIDFLILLGDRYEMLAIALAAMPFNIPIAHIGGGEISEGAIDDSIRHSLTKLSHLHFAITKKCAKRIRQMGEEQGRIKVDGSPRLDSKNNMAFRSKGYLNKKYGINFRGKVMLVVFHPTTLEIDETKKQMANLLKAVEEVNIETVIFYPNMDTNSDIIIEALKNFAGKRPNIKLLKPLEKQDYFSLLKAVDVLVGNSSIGIVEAPSFHLAAVNIGNRQKGRDRVGNVIDTDFSPKNIVRAVNKALYNKAFLRILASLRNPYGDGMASKRIVNILSRISMNKFSIVKKNCF